MHPPRLVPVLLGAVFLIGCASGGSAPAGGSVSELSGCESPRSTSPAVWALSSAGRIEGVVWDANYEGPLVGAGVALAGWDQSDSTRWRNAVHRTHSGPRGEFLFEGVRPGRYRVIAQAIGKDRIDGEPVEIVERFADADAPVRIEMRAGALC